MQDLLLKLVMALAPLVWLASCADQDSGKEAQSGESTSILVLDDFEPQTRSLIEAALGPSELDSSSFENWLKDHRRANEERLRHAFDYEFPPLVAYGVRVPGSPLTDGSVDLRMQLAAKLAGPPDGPEPPPLGALRAGDPDRLREGMVQDLFDSLKLSYDNLVADDEALQNAAQALQQKVSEVDAFLAEEHQRNEGSETRFLDWALKITTLTSFNAKIGILTDRLLSQVPESQRGEGVFRALVIGPGIDLVNQHLGARAPVATYQPWELAMSLIRHGYVKSAEDLELHVLDINPDIVDHLVAARSRAEKGESYPGALFAFSSSSDLHRPVVNRYLESLMSPVETWPSASFESMGRARSMRVELTEFYRRPTTEEEKLRSKSRAEIEWFRCAWPPDLVRRVVPFQGDVVSERFAENHSYDLVLCTNVLRYYEDPALTVALSNIHRVLKPQGILVTTYPTIGSRAAKMGMAIIASAKEPSWDWQYLLMRSTDGK